MAERFAINISDEAATQIGGLARYARRIVLDGIELHLRYRPTEETRRIKLLRPNDVAPWELRLGDYRVLYEVVEVERLVNVLVVGEKRGNQLFVLGREYSAHEDDRSARSEGEP